MPKIEGVAKKYDGTAIDYVNIFDWATGNCIDTITPDASGNWSYEHYKDINIGITYVADGCEPITHGGYFFNGDSYSFIGLQGGQGFGVGIFIGDLPTGFNLLDGTTTIGHEQFGNYLYSDGSVMCWIPLFYYRLGSPDSPRYAKYGLNAIDIKAAKDFGSVDEANAQGYALHRAFYDNGEIKNGFFVDKYLCSNNSGIASSIKNKTPLSTDLGYNPFSSLINSPSDTFAGAVDAVKTRGADFFVTTVFIQKALSLLATAHAQAVTSSEFCGWYDASGVNNAPKGNNHLSLARDTNDSSVNYTPSSNYGLALTGSGTPFEKTTHNGQSCGVADLNGNMYELGLGITHLSGQFHALKTSAKAASLMSGSTSATDAWGSNGVAANYEPLGAVIGALKQSKDSTVIGNGSNQVFSPALSGVNWQASCAGIPLQDGVSSLGSNLFGRDRFAGNNIDNVFPFCGGYWANGDLSGVWYINFNYPYTDTNRQVGVRAAMYV